MTPFVEPKSPNMDRVKEYLTYSDNRCQWTNFGPVSAMLEARLGKEMRTRSPVVMTASGTAALFGLVEMYNCLHGPLRWGVSAFGFHCTRQGPLRDAKVFDCDGTGMLDLNHVEDVDALVVTNLFGMFDVNKYRGAAKVVIIDSALGFDGPKGVNEIVSFHHTKPWGVGEGGCAIVPADHERLFRSVINFGTMTERDVRAYSFNGKISDIGCAFILDRMDRIENVRLASRRQYDRILRRAREIGFDSLAVGPHPGIPASVPLIAPKPVHDLDNPWVVLRKYYKPLEPLPMASYLYDRIVNFPCHPYIGGLSDNAVEDALKRLLA